MRERVSFLTLLYSSSIRVLAACARLCRLQRHAVHTYYICLCFLASHRVVHAPLVLHSSVVKNARGSVNASGSDWWLRAPRLDRCCSNVSYYDNYT